MPPNTDRFPPKNGAFSTTRTLAPSSAADIAATNPAPPPPITTTSAVFVISSGVDVSLLCIYLKKE